MRRRDSAEGDNKQLLVFNNELYLKGFPRTF